MGNTTPSVLPNTQQLKKIVHVCVVYISYGDEVEVDTLYYTVPMNSWTECKPFS